MTTRQRVKDRIAITVTGFDTLIDRMINSATDFIESNCSRRFKETSYTDEVYSIPNTKQEYLLLKNAPVSVLTSLQYAAGTPSSKSWTNFIADEYELLEDGKSGLIRVYRYLPRGVNVIRTTYTAGYKINFANFGDNSTHTLPADISDLAERLVIRFFKRREHVGKVSESFEGGNLTWKDLLDNEDLDTIARYTRMPVLV